MRLAGEASEEAAGRLDALHLSGPTQQVLSQYRADPLSVEPAALLQLGHVLSGALLDASGLGSAVQRELDRAYMGTLELELQFSGDSAALQQLPWELLARDGRFLFHPQSRAHLLRQIAGVPRGRLRPPPYARLLLVVASPSGMRPIPAQPVQDAISQNLHGQVEVLRDPSLEALTARLEAGGVDFLHIVAHGAAGAELVLSAGGRPQPVSAQALAARLAGHGLQLAVMCVCQSGNSDEGGVSPGLARELLGQHGGLSAVLAAQANLPVSAAAPMAAEFYAGLGRSGSFAHATHQARAALPDVWGVLVLLQRRQALLAEDVPGNVFRAQDDFFGRSREQAEIRRALSAPIPVTVTGMGGVGKTRLAREIAFAARQDFSGGVWLCELSTVRTLAGIYRALLVTLSLSMPSPPPADRIGWLMLVLRARGPMLLILDNVEQISEDAEQELAGMLARMQQGFPQLRVLITSRRRLARIAGQHVPLVPLPTAVAHKLLCARIRSHSPTLSAYDSLTDDVRGVLAQLDGFPILIEFTAHYACQLSTRELRTRLEEAGILQMPTPVPGSPPRHHSAARMVRWSWELLADADRQTLMSCVPFHGSFRRQDVEALLQRKLGWGPDLTRLLSHSLIEAVHLEPNTRFRLRKPVADFARDQLRAQPAAEAALFERHARHFAAQARLWTVDDPDALLAAGDLPAAARHSLQAGRLADAATVLWLAWQLAERVGDQGALCSIIDGLRPDVRRGESPLLLMLIGAAELLRGRAEDAVEWLVLAISLPWPAGEDQSAEATMMLVSCCIRLGRLPQAVRELEEALARPQSPGMRAKLLMQRAEVCHRMVDPLASKDALETALAVAKLAGEEMIALKAEARLRLFFSPPQQVLQQRHRLAEMIDAFAALPDWGQVQWLSGGLGHYHQRAGEYEAARQVYQRGLALTVQAPTHRAAVMFNLASLEAELGALGAARSLLRGALEVYENIGDLAWQIESLCGLVEVELCAEDLFSAEGCVQQALALAEPLRRREPAVSARVRCLAAKIRLAEGQPRRALELLERFVPQLNPQEPVQHLPALMLHAEAHQKLGALPEARAILDALASGSADMLEQMLGLKAMLLIYRSRQSLLEGDRVTAQRRLQQAEWTVSMLGLPDEAPLCVSIARLSARVAGRALTTVASSAERS